MVKQFFFLFEETSGNDSPLTLMCPARERESKAQGGTSRQETEEHGMQMYCCDAAVRGNGRESLFLNSLCCWLSMKSGSCR